MQSRGNSNPWQSGFILKGSQLLFSIYHASRKRTNENKGLIRIGRRGGAQDSVVIKQRLVFPFNSSA
jgi:hypothetical protein